MSLIVVRGEAGPYPKSLRTTPFTVSKLTITLHDSQQDVMPNTDVASVLSSRHTSTGQSSTDIRSSCDTRDVIHVYTTI